MLAARPSKLSPPCAPAIRKFLSSPFSLTSKPNWPSAPATPVAPKFSRAQNSRKISPRFSRAQNHESVLLHKLAPSRPELFRVPFALCSVASSCRFRSVANPIANSASPCPILSRAGFSLGPYRRPQRRLPPESHGFCQLSHQLQRRRLQKSLRARPAFSYGTFRPARHQRSAVACYHHRRPHASALRSR